MDGFIQIDTLCKHRKNMVLFLSTFINFILIEGRIASKFAMNICSSPDNYEIILSKIYLAFG